MRRACMLLPIALLLAACGDDAPEVPGDSPQSAATADSVPGAAVPTPSGWDGRAGPVLLVAGERPDEVLVVLPELQGDTTADTLDVSEHAGSAATLIGRGGVVSEVPLADGPGADPESSTCAAWPMLAAPAGTAPWTVGFIGDIAVIPLDSTYLLVARDSARIVADIARLASAVPATRTGDRAETFQGLPFGVRDARTFNHDGTEVLAAHVMRRVNQEANPLEEHTLLIAERAVGSAEWKTAYSDRVVGLEESAVRQEVLAAVLLGGQPVLVLAHEGGEGATYSLLQRRGSGWRTIWRSARARC